MADGDISIGELSRRFSEVLVRLDGIARRLEEGQFVRTDLYIEYRRGVQREFEATNNRLQSLETNKIDKSAEDRIKKLEDTNTWLIRLVIGFVVLAVLGAVFAASGGVT